MTTQTHQQLFITGASGYVGSVITEFAIAQGYKVHGLSRTQESDEKLKRLGATPIRGDLTSLDVLRGESAEADAVIHLATAFRFTGKFEDGLPTEMAALDAIAEGLVDSQKVLLITSGTLAAAADPTGAEITEEAPDPEESPAKARNKVEAHGLSLTSKGIHVVGIRLAAYVYGRGGSATKAFMALSKQTGGVTIIDGGKNRITTIHVDDAARLYLLALRKGKAGELFNASAATDMTSRQLREALAKILQLPVRDITYGEAQTQMGEFLTWFLSSENRASGAKARKELGWEPKETDILDDVSNGSYLAVAKALRDAT
ncbi:MAG: hypothetical protein Q9195_009119 [Heterodermia aff. obscurata]